MSQLEISANASVPHAEVTDKPLLKIRATRGMSALHLAETWKFRDLLWTLAGRDVKVRYKQTALGVIWVILNPLLNAGIFTFIFGTIAKTPLEANIPTFLYMFAGLQAWGLFSTMLTRVSMCLVSNGHLISKVFFPRFVLPLSIIPTVLLDFAIALAMLVVFIAMNMDKVVIGWPLLLLPFWVVLLILLALGLGLWLAALMVSYRDVSYVLPVAIQILMYGSAIMFSFPFAMDAVEHKFGHVGRTLFLLNPIVPIVQGFRWSVFGVTSVPEGWAVASATAACVVLLIVGAFVFKKMERQFADLM